MPKDTFNALAGNLMDAYTALVKAVASMAAIPTETQDAKDLQDGLNALADAAVQAGLPFTIRGILLAGTNDNEAEYQGADASNEGFLVG